MYAALHVLIVCCFIERLLSMMKLRLRTISEKSMSVSLRVIVCGSCKVMLTEEEAENEWLLFCYYSFRFCSLPPISRYLWHSVEVSRSSQSNYQAIQSDYVVYHLQTFHDEYSVCFNESFILFYFFIIYFITQVAEIHRAVCFLVSFSTELGLFTLSSTARYRGSIPTDWHAGFGKVQLGSLTPVEWCPSILSVRRSSFLVQVTNNVGRPKRHTWTRCQSLR